MTRAVFVVPAALFVAVAALFAVPFILELDPKALPTALQDQPAPAFELPPIDGMPESLGLGTADLRGRPSVVNIFASWCVPCLAEHPLITRLAEDGVPVHGINFRDEADDAIRWLRRHGNPYARVGADTDARASIEWGVTGVPETFVLDAEGNIRHKIVGPMTPKMLESEVLPLLRELER